MHCFVTSKRCYSPRLRLSVRIRAHNRFRDNGKSKMGWVRFPKGSQTDPPTPRKGDIPPLPHKGVWGVKNGHPCRSPGKEQLGVTMPLGRTKRLVPGSGFPLGNPVRTCSRKEKPASWFTLKSIKGVGNSMGNSFWGKKKRSSTGP